MSARTHRSTRTHHAIAALLAALLAVATMALTTSRAEADVVSRSWTFSSRSQVADWQANARLSRAGGSLQLANRHARARTLVMSSRHAVRPVTHRATYRLSTAVRATKPGQRVKLAVIERSSAGRERARSARWFRLGGRGWHRVGVNHVVARSGSTLGFTLVAAHVGRRGAVRVDNTKLTRVSVPGTGSGTGAGKPATVSGDPTNVVLVAPKSTWKYRYDKAAWPASWTSNGFSDAGWTSGTAPLGFGSSSVTTKIDTMTAGNRPLTALYRKSFTLSGVSELSNVKLSTVADDGVEVSVNGTEVGRTNLPSKALSNGTYATAAPRLSAALARKTTYTVPASLLRNGTNVVTASTHLNWRATPDLTFDAALVATRTPAATSTPTPTPSTPAPTTPTPTTSTPTPTTSTPTPTTSTPTPTDDGVLPGWGAPAWRDEFNGTSVDPTKWNVRDRSNLGLLQDVAVPTRDQVTESGGLLHLKADWLDSPFDRPAGQAGQPVLTHKTGYIDQRKLKSGDMSYSQRWGRWEVRAKTPTGPHTLGSLAAFWLRNSNSGEIDIMEAWGYNEKAAPGGQRLDTATTTIHTQTSGAGNVKRFWTHADTLPKKVVPWSGFHTYAFELTPSYAAIIVDGYTVGRATPATYPDLWNTSYFGSPLHVRLNLHVGPSEKYWGIPDLKNKAATQPLDYQIDHVRIWAYDPK